MPWNTIKAAKKAKAITKYKSKSIALAAINKLYDIYDSIKAQGKADNPFAVAMASWKDLIKLKDGRIWVLKPKKIKEQGDAEVAFPTGMSSYKDGSFESLKDQLANTLKDYFGKDNYVYVVATYKTKLIVSVEDKQTYTPEYYQVDYKINKEGIELKNFTKVLKVVSYQKAEQLRDFRTKIREFVEGKGKIGDAINVGMKLRRILICKP